MLKGSCSVCFYIFYLSIIIGLCIQLHQASSSTGIPTVRPSSNVENILPTLSCMLLPIWVHAWKGVMIEFRVDFDADATRPSRFPSVMGRGDRGVAVLLCLLACVGPPNTGPPVCPLSGLRECRRGTPVESSGTPGERKAGLEHAKPPRHEKNWPQPCKLLNFQLEAM